MRMTANITKTSKVMSAKQWIDTMSFGRLKFLFIITEWDTKIAALSFCSTKNL